MNTIAHANKKSADGIADAVTRDQLISDFKVVLADAEALLKATANQGGEKLDEIRARARDSIHAMNVRMGEAADAAKARTREAAKATDVYVHEHPWTAIGVASGIGLAVGMLIARR